MDKKHIRIMSLIIALLLVLMFTACGGKNDKPKEKDSGQTTEQTTADDKTAQTAEYPKTMYVTSEDGLILRKEAGTDKEAIQTLGYGDAIEVDKIEKGWAHTKVDGHEGWCSAEYLTEDKSKITPKKTSSGDDPNKLVEPSDISEYGEQGTINSSEGVNLRYGPGEDYGVITVIPDKAEVTEKGWTEGWTYISYDGKYGWVKAEYIVSQGGKGY